MLLSSHIVREVEALARRVAILRAGQLVSVVEVAELHRQARQRLDLYVEEVPDAAVFAHLDPVVECRVSGQVISVVVESPVDPVIKAAAQLTVRRVVSHEADLEDVFLAYYRKTT